MVDGVALALTSIKSAADMAKTLFELRDITKVREVTIELQGQIAAAQTLALAAQREQATLLRQIEDLKQKIVQFEDWESQKQRYELKAVDRGCFAYMPKPGMDNGEPPHWLCTNCFERRQKSILQFKGQDRSERGRGETSTYACAACNASIKVYYTRSPSKPWTEG